VAYAVFGQLAGIMDNIKVAAKVGLLDMGLVQMLIAALHWGKFDDQISPPLGQFFVGHVKMQGACINIDSNQVTISHPPKRAITETGSHPSDGAPPRFSGDEWAIYYWDQKFKNETKTV